MKAEQAVIDLNAMVDQLINDPKEPIQKLDTVATGEALEFFQVLLTDYRKEKLTGSGATLVEVESVKSSGSDTQGMTMWTVITCLDHSKTKLFDSAGNDVLRPPYRIQHSSLVVKRDGQMIVEQDEVLGTC